MTIIRSLCVWMDNKNFNCNRVVLDCQWRACARLQYEPTENNDTHRNVIEQRIEI